MLRSTVAAIGLAWGPGAAIVSTAQAQYEAVNPWDAAIRQLERATRFDRDGTHHTMLTALRQLNDPALKPLFLSLVQSDQWSMQVSGVFGLAELDPKGVVDPFLLAQVDNVADRSTAILAAVQLKMVDRAQAEAMLAWDDLTPRDRVVLYAEIARRGVDSPAPPADEGASRRRVEQLTALLDEESVETIGLAAFLLASDAAAPDPSGCDRLASALGEMNPRDRSTALALLAAAAATFELRGATDFIDGALKDSALKADARIACVAALLALSPDVGYAAWSRSMGASTTHSQRVRLALVLLASDITLPPNASAPLRAAIAAQGENATDDPLLGTIADAIDALAGGDVSSAFPALVRSRHVPSMTAALAAADRLNTAGQRATYGAFIDLLGAPFRESLTSSVIDLCLDASARLAKLDLAAVLARLDATPPEDPVLRDLLLLSLAGAHTPETAAAAHERREGGSKRTSSLILVSHARFAQQLPPEEVEELGRIAAGGSPLEGALQAQAAWLYARHSKRSEQAIAALLSKAPAPADRPRVTDGEEPERRRGGPRAEPIEPHADDAVESPIGEQARP